MTRIVNNPSGYHSKGRDAGEKAHNFALAIKEHGWSGKWTTDEITGVLHLFARRGENETIDVWWSRGGKALPDMLPIYTLAGETIKCRNVSAAYAHAANAPDDNRLKKAVRRQQRKLSNGNSVQNVTAETIASLQCSLPFDHESSDEELKDVLIGRTIVWVNRISGETDTAQISTDPKHFKVNRNGHDFISFVNPIPQRVLASFGKPNMESDTYGFRSVYLDSIVSVS